MTTERIETEVEHAVEALAEDGYTVIEGLLDDAEVDELREVSERWIERQRHERYDPGDGPTHPDDVAIETYVHNMYDTAPQEELERVLRLFRYNRAANRHTPWPVPIEQVLKNFIPRPEIEGHGGTVYVASTPPVEPIFARLVEDPTLLRLARSMLGDDCVLADMGLNSIGPGTDNGNWHVDVPLGQLPEPLPDFPLTVQNVWMIDDFTEANGATRVVPRSHLTRRKPGWNSGGFEEEEIAITGPAGSMAIWLSSTWHKPGANVTDRARRAVLCYFSRSWVKGYSDLRSLVTEKQAAAMSPTLRYLVGFSANAPVRRGPEPDSE